MAMLCQKSLIKSENYFLFDDLGSYGYGYNVSPDGQFHHETRGPDGVVRTLISE